MKFTRRDVVKNAALSAGALMLPGLAVAKQADGVVELRAKKAMAKLDPAGDAVSEVWTYNGSTPGPEIRVKQGERVKVRFVNELDEPSSIHWHGIRIDNAMDGVSGLTQEAVPTGGTFDYDFVAPDAGTYWYHAHNKSWNQVARGLYGPLIVEEAEPVFDKDHDITLIVDDWRLTKDGALETASFGSLRDWSHGGRLGNWLTVNGASKPDVKLNAGEAYRVRIINTANARVLRLQLEDLGASIIALDGQPLMKAEQNDDNPLVLTPAQRVDLLVTPQSAGQFELREISGSDPFAFATLTVTGNVTGTIQKVAAPVLPIPKLPEPDMASVLRIPLVMTGGAMGQMGEMMFNGKPLDRDAMIETKQIWALNGVANLGADPLILAKRGQTVVVELVNETAWPHGMHVHGHHFKMVSLNGTALGDEPWRDTIMVRRGEKVEIAFVADNPGKWLLHCHMLEHAAAGMNTWFEVA